MNIFKTPCMWLARGVVAAQRYTYRRWIDADDKMTRFVFLGIAISMAETALFSALLGLIAAGLLFFLIGYFSWPIMGLVFVMSTVTFLMAGMVRSPMPLSIWIDRLLCRRHDIRDRHSLDEGLFSVAQKLTHTPLGPKAEARRLDLARAAVMTLYLLWALNPAVRRDWEAKAIRAGSAKPQGTVARPRL